jgi:hypothetical protein
MQSSYPGIGPATLAMRAAARQTEAMAQEDAG